MPFSSKTGLVTSSQISDGTITDTDISASAGIDASKMANGSVSNAEFQRLDGVTSAIQAQLDAKVDDSQITAAALTVLDDATVAAMVDTLGGASSTGTGGLVRSTSPSLTTPTLGVASATSITFGQEALSQYDEGTYTPVITLSGGSGNTVPQYTNNIGRYTRIGNRCIVQVKFNGAGGNAGAGSGVILVTLPITTSASIANITMSCGYANNNSLQYNLVGLIGANGTTIQLSYWSISSQVVNNFTGAEQNNSDRILELNFSYEV